MPGSPLEHTAALLAPLLGLFGASTAETGSLAGDPPPELGRVEWGRVLEPALERSAKSGKPVWLQFQEVPG